MSLLLNFDEGLTARIGKLPESLRPLMLAATFIGDPLIVGAAGFSAYVLSLTYNHPAVQRALLYSVFAFLLNTALKLVMHRPRPHGLIIRNFGINSYSFPSGHAFGTVIFYGQFAHLIYLHGPDFWNIVLPIGIWLSIILIGISRVYLKAHYPSDVLAGWILGLISLTIINILAY